MGRGAAVRRSQRWEALHIKELFSIVKLLKAQAGETRSDLCFKSSLQCWFRDRTKLSPVEQKLSLFSDWGPRRHKALYPYKNICILPTGGQNYIVRHQRLL